MSEPQKSTHSVSRPNDIKDISVFHRYMQCKKRQRGYQVGRVGKLLSVQCEDQSSEAQNDCKTGQHRVCL